MALQVTGDDDEAGKVILCTSLQKCGTVLVTWRAVMGHRAEACQSTAVLIVAITLCLLKNGWAAAHCAVSSYSVQDVFGTPGDCRKAFTSKYCSHCTVQYITTDCTSLHTRARWRTAQQRSAIRTITDGSQHLQLLN